MRGVRRAPPATRGAGRPSIVSLVLEGACPPYGACRTTLGLARHALQGASSWRQRRARVTPRRPSRPRSCLQSAHRARWALWRASCSWRRWMSAPCLRVRRPWRSCAPERRVADASARATPRFPRCLPKQTTRGAATTCFAATTCARARSRRVFSADRHAPLVWDSRGAEPPWHRASSSLASLTRAHPPRAQLIGQALVAASRTVPDSLAVHSLHAYFLLPGDVSEPFIYTVQRTRDGRSFATRHVTAQQHGQPVFQMTASFQRQERGFEHAAPMPGALPAALVVPSRQALTDAPTRSGCAASGGCAVTG